MDSYQKGPQGSSHGSPGRGFLPTHPAPPTMNPPTLSSSSPTALPSPQTSTSTSTSNGSINSTSTGNRTGNGSGKKFLIDLSTMVLPHERVSVSTSHALRNTAAAAAHSNSASSSSSSFTSFPAPSAASIAQKRAQPGAQPQPQARNTSSSGPQTQTPFPPFRPPFLFRPSSSENGFSGVPAPSPDQGVGGADVRPGSGLMDYRDPAVTGGGDIGSPSYSSPGSASSSSFSISTIPTSTITTSSAIPPPQQHHQHGVTPVTSTTTTRHFHPPPQMVSSPLSATIGFPNQNQIQTHHQTQNGNHYPAQNGNEVQIQSQSQNESQEHPPTNEGISDRMQDMEMAGVGGDEDVDPTATSSLTDTSSGTQMTRGWEEDVEGSMMMVAVDESLGESHPQPHSEAMDLDSNSGARQEQEGSGHQHERDGQGDLRPPTPSAIPATATPITAQSIATVTAVPSTASKTNLAADIPTHPPPLARKGKPSSYQSGDRDRNELQLKDWEIVETLGTGTFGRVLLVRPRPPYRSVSCHPIFPRLNRQRAVESAASSPTSSHTPSIEETAHADAQLPHYALKVLAKSEVVRLKQVEHINSERAILERVRHPFLVELYATYQDHLNVYMLLSYVPGGELFSHLRRAGRFTADVTRFYLASIILAIDYLHTRDIIYRDLKPENLLLDRDGYLRIADFGFAKVVEDRTFTLCGTPEYLAPEIVLSKGHGKAVDWWALGILCFEMLAGYPPFFDDHPLGIYEKIIANKVAFPAHIDPFAKDLIRRLLNADRSRRLGNLRGGALDVINHRWFTGVDWMTLERRQIRAPIIPHVASMGDSQNFQRYKPPSPEDLPGILGIPQGSTPDPYKHLFDKFLFPAGYGEISDSDSSEEDEDSDVSDDDDAGAGGRRGGNGLHAVRDNDSAVEPQRMGPMLQTPGQLQAQAHAIAQAQEQGQYQPQPQSQSQSQPQHQ